MNYQRVYEQLIARARNRILDCYKECHHVVPRCMGGTDEPENLVELIGREHLLAHLLLVKMYPENEKLFLAAWLMSSLGKLNSKQYGWLKTRFSIASSERTKVQWNDPNFRERMSKIASKHMKIRWVDPSYRRSMSEKLTGNKNGLGNESWKQRVGKRHTIETKHKMSVSHIGSINSQYGTMWITNGIDNKKISKDVPIPDGWNKGRLAKKTA